MLLCSRLMAYRAFHCKICGIPRWHTYLGRSQESIDLSLVASSWHDHRRYLTLVGKVGKSPESKPFSRNIFSASSINGHLTQTSQVGTYQEFSLVAYVLRQVKQPSQEGRYVGTCQKFSLVLGLVFGFIVDRKVRIVFLFLVRNLFRRSKVFLVPEIVNGVSSVTRSSIELQFRIEIGLTKFGEILPLWHNFKRLWQFITS